MEVLETRPVTLVEVKKNLKDTEKRYSEEDRELLYEQRRAFEHAKKFASLNIKDTQKMMSDLKGLPLELTDEQIVKIVDLLPDSVDDVRAIFAKERFKYSAEDIKSIVDTADKFR